LKNQQNIIHNSRRIAKSFNSRTAVLSFSLLTPTTLISNCKVLVLGDRGVGKTAIVHRFISAEFRGDFKATIGVDFCTERIEVDRDSIELQIWDTAGEERHNSLAPVVFRGVDACILVFDVSDATSFEHIEWWRRQVIDFGKIHEPETFPFVVFANKCDLDAEAMEVSIDQAKSTIEEQHMRLFEVSAKTGQNISEGFETAASQFIEWRKMSGGTSQTPLRIDPNPTLSSPTRESQCC
jgi:small GTP-binding protein